MFWSNGETLFLILVDFSQPKRNMILRLVWKLLQLFFSSTLGWCRWEGPGPPLRRRRWWCWGGSLTGGRCPRSGPRGRSPRWSGSRNPAGSSGLSGQSGTVKKKRKQNLIYPNKIIGIMYTLLQMAQFDIEIDLAPGFIYDFPRVLPFLGLQSPKICPRNSNMTK